MNAHELLYLGAVALLVQAVALFVGLLLKAGRR